MHNYLNTSSSFGFTSESSNSPDPKLAQPDETMQHFRREAHQYLPQRAHIQDESDVPLHEQEYSKLFQQSDRDHQNNINEQIYLSIFSIKIKNTFRLLFRLLDHRVLYYKQLAFRKISQSAHNRIQLKTCSQILNAKDLYSLLKAFRSVQSQVVSSKMNAVQVLVENMKEEKSKELKLLYILGRRVACLQKQVNSLIRFAFGKLKLSGSNVVSKSWRTSRSKNFNKARRIIACKLIAALISKKHYNSFRNFKCSICQWAGEPLRKVDVYGSKTKSSANRVSTGSLQSQLGYQYQAASRKMMKMSNKSIELRIESKEASFARCTQLNRVTKNLIQKQYKLGLHRIIAFCSRHEDQSQRKSVSSGDDPAITSSILRHLCWVSGNQPEVMKQEGQNQMKKFKQGQQKLFVLRLRMQQRESISQVFRKWSNNAIAYRLGIMERVRQLEELKESLIENYK